MTFTAYKVAVKLTLIDGVSAGLGSLAAQFHKLNGNATDAQSNIKKLEKSLLDIKNMGLIGGGLATVGGLGLGLFKAPLEEAVKFDQQVSKLKLFGMSDKVNAEAVSFAKGMKVIGSSYTENMKLMIEAQGVFRESGLSGSEALDGAKLAAPFLAKIAFATKSLDGESAAKLTQSAMSMLRYVEDSGGLKSPEKFQQLADAGWKMVQTSGGSVSWEQLRQFKARAGVAGMDISGDGMAELEPIITMLKGQTAGFSLRTAYNRLNGIVKIPNQVAHELVNSGLWDGSKVEWNAMGGIKAFKGNPFKHAQEFADNPVEAYAKYIVPLHEKMGLKTDAQIAQANAMMFGSTGGNLFTLVDKNLDKLRQSLDAQNKALGVDASVKVAGDSASGKMVDLHAKWANVLTELGATVLPVAIRGVEWLTATLKSAIDFMNEFPALTKGLAIAFGVLAGAAAIGGVLMVTTAAFRALGLALSVGGFGGGGVALAKMASGLSGVGVGLLTLGNAIPLLKAAMIGWTIGTIVNEFLSDEIKDAIGGNIAGIFALFGSESDKDTYHHYLEQQKKKEQQENARLVANSGGTYSPGAPVPYAKKIDPVRTAQQQQTTIHTQINLDGHEMGSTISRYMGKWADSPQKGASGHDGRMGVISPAGA